jgi:hypothetical protein
MIEVTPDLFGITLDIRFANARPFSKERLDRLLSRLTDSENGLALRIEQMRLRNTDFAFDYELKAVFLGANACFVYDAEKFFLSISGGRTQADADLLRETVKRFFWTSEISDQESGIFGASTHARAESTEKRDEFLTSFRVHDQIVGPGALAYIRAPNWSEDIRFAVEPSLGLSDALFLAWNTRFRGTSWLSSTETLTNILESSASVFGVRFKPFVQR